MNYEHFKRGGKNIYLIDMTKERDYYISEMFSQSCQKFFSRKKNIAILRNSKGYARGVHCKKCGSIPNCSDCDVAIAYHAMQMGGFIGLCHICKKQYDFPKSCASCGDHAIDMYGMGHDQLAKIIESRYGVTPLCIHSASFQSKKKMQSIDHQISTAQCVIGTSLLTTPPYNKEFSLLVLGNIDMGLHVPDYRSAENVFLTIYEACKKYPCEHILVQSHVADHYAVRFACAGDRAGFTEREHARRKNHLYPPFGEICVVLYKHEIEATLHTKVDTVYKEMLYLKQLYGFACDIFTTPPMIYKAFGKYRYNIVIKGKNVREFMDIAYPKLQLPSRGFKVDWQALGFS